MAGLKKALFALLMLVACTALGGCNEEEEAKKTFTEFLAAVQRGNYDELRGYLDMESLQRESMTTFIDISTGEVLTDVKRDALVVTLQTRFPVDTKILKVEKQDKDIVQIKYEIEVENQWGDMNPKIMKVKMKKQGKRWVIAHIAA